MTGNIVNFSRLIMRSRDFPSLEDWRRLDRETYDLAAHYGILDRHEIQRHMRPSEMELISLEDVLRDLPKRKSPRSWRRSAPIFYWKCYHEKWFDLPEIRAFVKDAEPTYLKRDSLTPASRRGKTVVSASTGDDLDDSQIRHKIQNSGLLLDAKFIQSFPDQIALNAILKDEIAQDRLIKLSKELYIKSYIATQDLDQIRQSIIDAMIFELKWKVIPCCQTLAIEHGLTPRSNTEIGLETTGPQLSIRLSQIPGGGNSVIRIKSVRPKRYELNQTREGRVLRALMGVDDQDVPEAVTRLLGRMKPVELREVRSLVTNTSLVVRREIYKLIESKAGS